MKVACFTTFYPEMSEFANDYLDSVCNQTYKDFELVIVNDSFPFKIDTFIEQYAIPPVQIFDCTDSPLKNRMYGLEKCLDLKYDVVICSDSDETMDPGRIEKVVAYFSRENSGDIVFNNSVGKENDCYFDLHYKENIRLEDNIDFNVLGYGALNIKRELIPFVLQHVNENVLAFDWWLGIVFLLNFGKVDFLKEAKNNYRCHSGNAIGPIFDITKEKIKIGIKVKKTLYSELIQYCHKNDFIEKVGLFRAKLNEIIEIEDFLKNCTIEYYTELVEQYFKNAEKIYWWQFVVPIKKLQGSLI